MNDGGKKKKRSSKAFLGFLVIGIYFILVSAFKMKAPASAFETYINYIISGDFSSIYNICAGAPWLSPCVLPLKLWSLVFGDSVTALRFMSIFLNLISITLLFQIFKKWLGGYVACCATFLYVHFLAVDGLSWRMGNYPICFLIFTLVFFVLYIIYIEKGHEKTFLKPAYIVISGVFVIVELLVHLVVWDVSEVLGEVKAEAKNDTVVLVSNLDIFYDAKFYADDKMEVEILSEDVSGEKAAAILNIRDGLVEDRNSFLAEHKSFWYVVRNYKNGERYEIPEWARNYRVGSEISLGIYSALEFIE